MAIKGRKQRLNLVISDASKRRLDRLGEITEADTSAEVVKNALQLYEMIIDTLREGKELLLRDKATGDLTVYQPFFGSPTTENDDDVTKRQGQLMAPPSHQTMRTVELT